MHPKLPPAPLTCHSCAAPAWRPPRFCLFVCVVVVRRAGAGGFCARTVLASGPYAHPSPTSSMLNGLHCHFAVLPILRYCIIAGAWDAVNAPCFHRPLRAALAHVPHLQAAPCRMDTRGGGHVDSAHMVLASACSAMLTCTGVAGMVLLQSPPAAVATATAATEPAMRYELLTAGMLAAVAAALGPLARMAAVKVRIHRLRAR
jgi:hypothetical protein